MSRIADLADTLHYLADALRHLDIISSLPLRDCIYGIVSGDIGWQAIPLEHLWVCW